MGGLHVHRGEPRFERQPRRLHKPVFDAFQFVVGDDRLVRRRTRFSDPPVDCGRRRCGSARRIDRSASVARASAGRRRNRRSRDASAAPCPPGARSPRCSRRGSTTGAVGAPFAAHRGGLEPDQLGAAAREALVPPPGELGWPPVGIAVAPFHGVDGDGVSHDSAAHADLARQRRADGLGVVQEIYVMRTRMGRCPPDFVDGIEMKVAHVPASTLERCERAAQPGGREPLASFQRGPCFGRAPYRHWKAECHSAAGCHPAALDSFG